VIIKQETPAEILAKVRFVDSFAGRIQLPVLVACAEKMVVSEEDSVHLQECKVKRRWAFDQNTARSATTRYAACS